MVAVVAQGKDFQVVEASSPDTGVTATATVMMTTAPKPGVTLSTVTQAQVPVVLIQHVEDLVKTLLAMGERAAGRKRRICP